MSGPGDDHLTRAQTELGEPDALFHISPGWLRAKLGVGLGLVLVGAVANYWWWVHGPQNLGHVVAHLLLWTPAVGIALLVHMYRQRGLFVLVYPTGLLRLRRGEVDSYPWAEVAEIRLKVQRAEAAEILHDAAGNPTACWLPAEVPVVQIWNAWLAVDRADGTSANFSPALADYARLAEEVQRRTFPAAWAAAWGRFRAGETVPFTDLEATPAGLRHAGKLLHWREVKELTVAQGRLTVKQAGRWLPWAIKDVSVIPNPHVLFALVEEARKLHAAPTGQPHPDEADHGAEDGE
ncbi:MAG: hypothetical protein JWO38_3971 [Gemmataceae bacterium]|nr:hypothetical protein [Gemmataceae bacterium]